MADLTEQPVYQAGGDVAGLVKELIAKSWQSVRIGKGKARREDHVTVRAASALTVQAQEIERLKGELAKCGGDNCWGQMVDGYRRWVSQEALDASEAARLNAEEQRDRLAEALKSVRDWDALQDAFPHALAMKVRDALAGEKL